MKNFALIGNGFIGSRHVSSIRSIEGSLLMMCDIDKSKHIDGIPSTSSYEFLTALPGWKDVDCVVVCTPNDLHAEISRWAERHGKDVICEKPFHISDDLDGFTRTNVVMQLRHHPMMEELKKVDFADKDIHLYVRVKRGPEYWTGWKGDESRSGGILFNLGVHYLDAMLNLLGTDYQIIETTVGQREAYAVVKFKGIEKPVRMNFSITDTNEGQDRFIMVDDTKYRFSDKDNLSFEDLHTKVYEDYLNGRGIKPETLKDLTRFILNLKGNV